jgi:hypothetical protein
VGKVGAEAPNLAQAISRERPANGVDMRCVPDQQMRSATYIRPDGRGKGGSF